MWFGVRVTGTQLLCVCAWDIKGWDGVVVVVVAPVWTPPPLTAAAGRATDTVAPYVGL